MAALAAVLRAQGRVVVSVKAVPKSSENVVAGVLEHGGFKVKVTAPPEKGKANAAICEVLAKAFGVSKSNVVVLRGETASQKLIEITC